MSKTVPKKDAQKPFWIKAIKKPVIVEMREVIPTHKDASGEYEIIKTLEGDLIAHKNTSFVIRGVEGELYPIRKDIFVKTYKLITSEQEAQLT